MATHCLHALVGPLQLPSSTRTQDHHVIVYDPSRPSLLDTTGSICPVTDVLELCRVLASSHDLSSGLSSVYLTTDLTRWFRGLVGYGICLTRRTSPVRSWAKSFFSLKTRKLLFHWTWGSMPYVRYAITDNFI